MIEDGEADVVPVVGEVFPECHVHIVSSVGVDRPVESSEFIGPVDEVPLVVVVVAEQEDVVGPVLVFVVGELDAALGVEVVVVRFGSRSVGWCCCRDIRSRWMAGFGTGGRRG